MMPRFTVLLLTAWTATRGTQERALYVSDAVGDWRMITGTDTAMVSPLDRVPPGAKLWYAGDRPRDKGWFVAIRDPRTLRKSTIRCGQSQRCELPARIDQLSFAPTSKLPAAAGEMAAQLGERDALRGRIRLVGARSGGRDLGLVVAGTSGIATTLAEKGGGLVARLCPLENDDDDCLTNRRMTLSDCVVDATSCTRTPGAYRVDLYRRERTMLGSVAEWTGVTLVVADARRAAVEREATTRLNDLAGARHEFGDDEWRGLLAVLALRLAGSP